MNRARTDGDKAEKHRFPGRLPVSNEEFPIAASRILQQPWRQITRQEARKSRPRQQAPVGPTSGAGDETTKGVMAGCAVNGFPCPALNCSMVGWSQQFDPLKFASRLARNRASSVLRWNPPANRAAVFLS